MWSYHLPSGIQHSATLQWVRAARWHGMTWQQFCDCDGDTQSFLVAAYITVMQCEAVEADQASKSKPK